MDAVRGLTNVLQDELEKVKENLKGVDENIKKLYGRDPTEHRPVRRVQSRDAEVGGARTTAVSRLFGEARRIINNPNREPIATRPIRRVMLGDGPRLGGIQDRLGPKRGRESGDEEDESPHKRAVQSSVVLNPKEPIKREESIALKTDQRGMERNKRMFGALLGTLQRFQSDSKKEENKEKLRQEVEKKLEEKQREEKNKLRRDRAALWGERRAKQRELRQLEYKMRLVKMFEDWEKEIRKQTNFIRTTKGKPCIYFKPKMLIAANERQQKETIRYIDGVVADKRKRLEQEIERLMASTKSQDAPPKVANGDQPTDDHKSSDEEDNSELEEDNSLPGTDSEIEEGEVRSAKRRNQGSAELEEEDEGRQGNTTEQPMDAVASSSIKQEPSDSDKPGSSTKVKVEETQEVMEVTQVSAAERLSKTSSPKRKHSGKSDKKKPTKHEHTESSESSSGESSDDQSSGSSSDSGSDTGSGSGSTGSDSTGSGSDSGKAKQSQRSTIQRKGART